MEVFRKINIADGNYCIGDIIRFSLNDGEKVEALAVKQEQGGMIFVLADCLKKEYQMNPTGSNKGGYEKCALRGYLNGEIFDRFPAEIRERMVTFPNGDFLRLPTECEIFGENIEGENEDESVQQWEPMMEGENQIARSGMWYWLQNKAAINSTDFVFVDDFSDVLYSRASFRCGVRPVFKLK